MDYSQLTGMYDTMNTILADTPVRNLMCTCNNEWWMIGATTAICLLFWVIGYLTGGNVAREP